MRNSVSQQCMTVEAGVEVTVEQFVYNLLQWTIIAEFKDVTILHSILRFNSRIHTVLCGKLLITSI